MNISSAGEFQVRISTLGCLQLAWRTSEKNGGNKPFLCHSVQQRLTRHLWTEYARRFHSETGSARLPGFDLQLEVGLCEISCSSSPPIDDSPALIYCNLISPQLVGDSTVRICGHSSSHYHHVSTSFVTCIMCLSSRGDFRTSEGLHITLEDCTTPTKVVHRFRKNYKW